jgi:hypothetical protein
VEEDRLPHSQGDLNVADQFRMTEDDIVAPDASPLEDILELSLLTAGPATGPVDRPRIDHRHYEL